MRAAVSTPHPLARERQHGEKRGTLGKHRAAPARISNPDSNSNGLTPAKTIQKDDAPLARRTTILTNEHESKTRLVALSRIEALRVEIRRAVDAVSSAVDVARLDLMCDAPDDYSRHKAGEEARTWVVTAGIQLETGLMQLERAMPPLISGSAP